MQRRFFAKRRLKFSRHPRCRKNKDGRDIGLKDLELIVDLSFVRDDHANRIRCLTARGPRFTQVCFRQPEPDVVTPEGAMTDQNGVGQRALAKQMRFVFARSEIDRREITRGDLAIDRHGKGRADKWTMRFSLRGWRSSGGFTLAR